jgi:23S rRNA pseudoU1915 N3-methylase RlmH
MIHIHTFDIRDKLYAPLITDYAKRMPSVQIFSHQSSKATPSKARLDDAQLLIPIIQKKYLDRTRVYLSEHGQTLSSQSFAKEYCQGTNCVFFL